jgi:heme A synthase
MRNPWLHRYAALVAAGTLYVVVTGALTASALAANQGGNPVSGHRAVASVLGVLVIGLVVWLMLVEKRGWLRRLSWIALAGVVAEAGLGEMSGIASPMISMVHAFLAPLLLAVMVAITVGTSKSWQNDPVLMADQGWPSLRGVARNTLVLVVIQVALGALFRYDVIGVMTHILGALVVAVFILTLVVLVTMMPEHPTLRPAAVTLGVVTFVQIFLGLTVVSMGSAKTVKVAAVVFGVAHVATGAITLAVTLVVALEVWRNVRPASQMANAGSAETGQGLTS